MIQGTLNNQSGATYNLSDAGSQLVLDDTNGTASMVNNGSFAQSGGTATLMRVSGTGSFAVSGGLLTVSGTSNTLRTLNVNGSGLVQVEGDGAVLEVTNLALADSGKLDLKSNDLIWHGGSVADVTGWLKSGYVGRLWTGPGIVSSTVAPGAGLGVMSGSDYRAIYGINA